MMQQRLRSIRIKRILAHEVGRPLAQEDRGNAKRQYQREDNQIYSGEKWKFRDLLATCEGFRNRPPAFSTSCHGRSPLFLRLSSRIDPGCRAIVIWR